MSVDPDVVVGFAEETGFPVFPCIRGKKEPLTPRGFHDASAEPAQIRKWARQYPGCNWGLATEAAGLFVLDVDVKDGKTGDESLRLLESRHGRLPETWQVLTPTGGTHFYFKANGTAIKSGTDRLGNGLDVKARGAYVMIPPSEVDGKRYAFEASSDPCEVNIAEIPHWLGELAADKPHSKQQAEGGAGDDRPLAWIRNIAQGVALHDSLRDLSAHLASKGLCFEEMRALLEALMNASAAPKDDRWRGRFGEIAKLVNSAIEKFRGSGPSADSAPEEWPEPIDFLRRPFAAPLDADDTVPAIADYALAFARAGGFCPSATILSAVTVCAAAVDDGIRLLLPGRSSWFESARLWGVTIGPPASGKTPCARAMLAPLIDLHRELFMAWQQQKAMKRDASTRANEVQDEDDEEPLRALLTNDCTIEALSDVLRANPRGVLYQSDEFESWIGSHDCYRGNGTGSRDRGEWLRLYDGGPHQINRISRGNFFVSNWGCSILSATTPGALKKLAPKLPADGLLQRFLPVLVEPMRAADASVYEFEVRRAKERYEAAVKRLHGLAAPATVKLGRKASDLFEDELAKVRSACDAAESVSDGLSSHLAKHGAMLARLVLVYHCINAEDLRAEVGAEPMHAAVNFMRKIRRHALALYFDLLAASAAPAVAIARDVGRLLIAHTPQQVRRRDFTQKVRSFRSAAQHMQDAATQYLVGCNWLEPIPSAYDTGRPTAWAVNPKIASKFAAEGAAERERRAAVRELIAETVEARRADKC